MRKYLSIAALALAVLLSASCTPEQVSAYLDITGPVHAAGRDAGLTATRLDKLRLCESGGNYEAVNPSGRFRGAYQFNQRTWDGVAERHFPWLVGNDPAATESWWQDAMARALWSERGSQPWPHCGRVALSQ